MTLSIAQKLIAAFVGLTLVLLIATLGLARWSFEQGFLDYVNALEKKRLERVAGELTKIYLSSGKQWSSLTEQQFAEVVHRYDPRVSSGALPGDGMPPPPGRRRPPQHMGSPRNLPTALYDDHNTLLAGPDLDKAGDVIQLSVVVEGNTVGELRSEPRRVLTSPLETEFSRQQLRTSWILGITSLVLAFAISLLLARGLLAPVRRMIFSVAQLSSGKYSYRMNEDRSDELGQLTRDIDRLGATLEANQSSRKRLLADISHELRTPLTVLAGEIEALQDGVRTFDRSQLGSLEQEVQRLRHLVDDLYELSISDMGGLRYQFVTTDIALWLQQAVAGIRTRALAQGIELDLLITEEAAATGLTIEADTQRLDQLLQNLLENSLAYTDAPGRIQVTLSCGATTANITIEDSAPGVGADDCEALFDPLYRQEGSRSRRTGGAGLGLAICRNIVTAHGGSITASPAALGGVCIVVKLPMSGARHT